MTMKLENGKTYRMRNGGKVGPMGPSLYIGDYWARDAFGSWGTDGQSRDAPEYDIIAEWSFPEPGPVITETLIRIVPGTYGHVTVGSTTPDGVLIGFLAARMKEDDLTEIIGTLTAVRDALRGGAK